MDKKELKFILQEGEGFKLEFKERLSNIDKDIAAFANAGGGRIFLGVNDKSEVIGINITNKLKSEVQSIARNCDPSIEIKLERFENILIIKVEEGDNKPYRCREGFYMRIGANSQKMNRNEIVSMVIGEGKVRFDEQINKKFNFNEDFNKTRFRLFLKENNLFSDLNTKDILVSLGLAIRKDKKLFINNAGTLLFGKEPQRFFLHAYLDCILFKGKEKYEIIDRKTFRSDLLDQLLSSKEFLKRHLNLRYEFKGFEREDKYELPLRAIEEALVNALMHRDYFFKGANISLFIFDDRVEIVSPGGLPKGLDKRDFGRLSVRRNQIIADIFSKTPYVEQTGSGIKRMRLLMKKTKLLPPKFKFTSFFKVTFKRPNLTPQVTPQVTPPVELTQLEKKIVNEIKKELRISRKELAKKLDISTDTIKEYLRKLRDKGKLRRIGKTSAGYWEVIDKNKNSEG